MSARAAVHCVVCQAIQVQGAGWFQLVENRWTDRLRILRFQERFSHNVDVYNVCGCGHLREMVVHWMTTGKLDHPFARVPFAPRNVFKRHATEKSSSSQMTLIRDAEFVGELAVHRESLTRILRQNPIALAGLIEAVVEAAQAKGGLHPPLSGEKALRAEESISF